ncbi:MAG: hypothetical protein MUF64_00815 [Polyangiaceae bacterium]|jgi:hypothetical protein|nr:hypothetical protein [Polyangiaceae bacterium]
MSEEEMKETFERVLEGLGLAASECREGNGWWRFHYRVSFQGGIHNADFRVVATLCELNSEVDLDALYADMRAANEALPPGSLAGFVEEDNYLHVKSRVPFEGLDEALLRAQIEACAALAESSTGRSLRSRYRSW